MQLSISVKGRNDSSCTFSITGFANEIVALALLTVGTELPLLECNIRICFLPKAIGVHKDVKYEPCVHLRKRIMSLFLTYCDPYR